ncbi:MAG: lipid A biosynthesis acyltransferase [Bacteroidetes bacterium HGW-Bacteroidetes-21]|jgi:KDO2-lipid IV(A) lauroyltransferase|nr:MAG: lipid A biosynthesis acyltransferase [Bacteroidetes bacterium HGW-Bacteroidetes-21]
MPFWFIYGMSNFFAFLLSRVFRYRYKVVHANLTRAFPEKSEKEKKKIFHAFYRNLGDLLVESMKGFTMSDKELYKRLVVLNPEVLTAYEKTGKSIMAVTAHTGNWEWGILSAPHYTKMIPAGLYKPLSNKRIDAYMRRNRSRTGSVLCSIYLTGMSFQKYIDKGSLFLLIADQSPSNLKKSYWVNFFGTETACLHGPEKYATMFNLPVYFFSVHRVKRGYYQIEFSKITDTPNELPSGKITEIYMGMLESYIRKNPSNWLWSHRRWKHKRSDYN